MTTPRKIIVPDLPLTGGCQCGAVRYRITAPPLTLYACHCTECQKQSASAFGLSLRVPKEAVELTGETASMSRSDPDAPFTEGVFCPACGTRIMHRRPTRDTVNIKAGTLDDTSWLMPIGHLWTQSAQAGFRPHPDDILYDRQPDDYEALIAAWSKATAS
ncbi:MAG: GFA family protein [Pseudomonadota bacterium]